MKTGRGIKKGESSLFAVESEDPGIGYTREGTLERIEEVILYTKLIKKNCIKRNQVQVPDTE